MSLVFWSFLAWYELIVSIRKKKTVQFSTDLHGLINRLKLEELKVNIILSDLDLRKTYR